MTPVAKWAEARRLLLELATHAYAVIGMTDDEPGRVVDSLVAIAVDSLVEETVAEVSG